MRKIKTAIQFEKEYRRFKLEVLNREVFNDVSEKAKEERRRKGEKGVWDFAEIYFPEYVKDKKAKFHLEWEKIRKIRNEPVLVVAARGFGKSTFFTFLDTLYDICYAKSIYNVIASYTELKAKLFTMRILLELKYNKRLITDFGTFFEDNKKTSIGYFIVKNKIYNKSICVQAISIGQDPRGLVFGPYRPTAIKLDDIQSYKRAQSKRNTIDSVNWLNLNILPAMDRDYKCIIVATFLNDRCFASTLYKGDREKDIPSIKTYIYPAEKRNKPTWQEKFPKERLKKLREKMGVINYNQEMLCIPKPLEGRLFDKSNIIYFKMNEIIGKDVNAIVSATDFSLTSKGDYKATILVSLIDGKFYVLASRIRKERLSSHISYMYELYNQYNPERMYYEDVTEQKENVTTLQEAFMYYEREFGYPLPLERIRNTENKIARIEATLSNLIENKKILFNYDDEDIKVLIEQLYEFPDGEADDGVDALEMAVRKALELMRRRIFLPALRKVKKVSSILEGY